MFKFSRLTATALAFGLAAPASAATLTQQGVGTVFGGNGSIGVTIASPTAVSGQAGGIALHSDTLGLGDFVAWCLDIDHFLDLSQNYEITSDPFTGFGGPDISDGRLDLVQALFNTAYSGLNLASNAQSGGFQLALWEIVYEDLGAIGNVGSGNFRVSSALLDAQTAANGFLDGLITPTITGHYAMTFLESNSSQDLVTVSPVPLPAAGLLLIAALGGLGMARRRKA